MPNWNNTKKTYIIFGIVKTRFCAMSKRTKSARTINVPYLHTFKKVAQSAELYCCIKIKAEKMASTTAIKKLPTFFTDTPCASEFIYSNTAYSEISKILSLALSLQLLA